MKLFSQISQWRAGRKRHSVRDGDGQIRYSSDDRSAARNFFRKNDPRPDDVLALWNGDSIVDVKDGE